MHLIISVLTYFRDTVIPPAAKEKHWGKILKSGNQKIKMEKGWVDLEMISASQGYFLAKGWRILCLGATQHWTSIPIKMLLDYPHTRTVVTSFSFF